MTGVARGKIIRVVVTWWDVVGMIGREPWPDDIGERWRRFDIHWFFLGVAMAKASPRVTRVDVGRDPRL